ncbi:MAG: citrate synthase [Candidatus Porifericomitaceae bacterium WSBS_2022_MAG_OTU9]
MVKGSDPSGSKHTVTITDNNTGKSLECDVIHGTDGPPVIDIRKLYGTLGMFSLDPGFASTASCRSSVTYLDGEQGVLMHRGYPIEQLAEHSNYLEVSYLLMYGELPNQQQMSTFREEIHNYSIVHSHLEHFYLGYLYDAHPMSIMAGITSALSSYYHEALDIQDREDRDVTAKRIIAKMPIFAANCYKYSTGRPFAHATAGLEYVDNFLNMMFSVPHMAYEANPVAARALDLLLILHADHEQNASTSTVRLSGSAEANPFACISAGIVTLWGRAHGGANEAVISMLKEIKTPDNIDSYLARAKDKKDPFRLMGFGHRVYKNHDPRATIIRKACHDLLKTDSSKIDQGMLDIAMHLEEVALKDEYFIERSLYPNVDFYSGIILQALGIPTSMFTVIFAMARSAGWISQWLEMMVDEDLRIGRPRQLYIGKAKRDYVPIGKR